MILPVSLELTDYIADHIVSDIKDTNHSEAGELLTLNAQATGRYGFTYGGRFYDHTSIRRNSYKQPDPSILPRVQAHYLAVTKFNSKLTRLKQGLTLPLRVCKTHQDIRDMLPDVVSYLPILSSYQRTRPVAYALQDNPQQMQEYEETCDLITYFLSARMFT